MNDAAVDLVLVRVVAHRLDAGRDADQADAGRDEGGAADRHDRGQERAAGRIRLLGDGDPLAYARHEPDQTEEAEAGEKPADVDVRAVTPA